MKTQIVFFQTAAFIFASCNAQNAPESSVERQNLQVGRTVAELGNKIWYVFQDSKGHYWFGSDGEGVFFFDDHSLLNITTRDGLSSDRIRQIQEDKQGNMYFSTLGGIDRFDGNRLTTLRPVVSHDWQLHPDDMWFSMIGADQHGPCRWDGSTLYNLQFPKHFLHDEMHKEGTNTLFNPYEVYCIYKDRSGNMWFGTSVFGACRFDGKSLNWMYEESITITQNGGSFGIRSIFEDRDGLFWLCNSAQLFKFDEAATAQSDRLQYERTPGIGNRDIFGGDDYIFFSNVVEDSDGAIWLTTWAQGVYKYHNGGITHFSVRDAGENVNLVSMYQDRQGILWLGTPDNGAFKFNGTSFERFRP